MTTARFRATATLLPSGKVLIAGGSDSPYPLPLASAELYDPAGNGGAGAFSSTGSMRTARYNATATLLPNGKVLIAGGDTANYDVESGAELYDPAGNGGAGSFSSTGSMATLRTYATATLLRSGKVLIAGGFADDVGSLLASAELYDPAGNGGAGAFSSTGSMTTARGVAIATLLPNGKVLIAGGFGGGVSPLLASAELYDPLGNGGAGSFSLTGGMATGRDEAVAAVLPNGKVLIAGGIWLASAELYDPSGNGGAGSFSPTGSMATVRGAATATLLPSGKVLVAGGLVPTTFKSRCIATAELYEPAGDGGLGSFSSTGSMTAVRSHATATLLPSGKVLIAGGGCGVPERSAELYSP